MKKKKAPQNNTQNPQNKHKSKCITSLLQTKMKYFYGSKRF